MATLKEINDNSFEKEVYNSDNYVLVDFWAPWCGPCRMQTPILENIQEQFDFVSIVKLNTDENKKISEKFDITTIPTLILFKGNAIIEKMVGVQDEDTLLKKLSALKN